MARSDHNPATSTALRSSRCTAVTHHSHHHHIAHPPPRNGPVGKNGVTGRQPRRARADRGAALPPGPDPRWPYAWPTWCARSTPPPATTAEARPGRPRREAWSGRSARTASRSTAPSSLPSVPRQAWTSPPLTSATRVVPAHEGSPRHSSAGLVAANRSPPPCPTSGLTRETPPDPPKRSPRAGATGGCRTGPRPRPARNGPTPTSRALRKGRDWLTRRATGPLAGSAATQRDSRRPRGPAPAHGSRPGDSRRRS